MDERATGRFELVVEERVPQGGLHELEQTTYYQVVDWQLGRIALTFEGVLEASLSTDTGLWDEYRLLGVRDVCISPDELSVIVKHCDGREETVQLLE